MCPYDYDLKYLKFTMPKIELITFHPKFAFSFFSKMKSVNFLKHSICQKSYKEEKAIWIGQFPFKKKKKNWINKLPK